MIGVKFNIVGIKQIVNKIGIVSREMKDETTKTMRNVSLFMEKKVKLSVAGRSVERRSVDTGRFINSIKGTYTSDTAKIYSKVPYSKHLEYGTTQIRPRKHFRNSLARNRKKINKYVIGGVRAAVKRF